MFDRLYKVIILLIILFVALPIEAAQKRIAVLPFENSTGQKKYEPLEEGLADLIVSDLAKVKGIEVVERKELDKILKEWKLSLRGIVDEESAVKVGKLVGARIILTGGFSLVEKKLKINAHLFDVETSQLIKSEEITGKISDVVSIEKKLVFKILEDLDFKIDSLQKREIDESPEVNLHFIRGLGYYYGCMYDHAVMEFINTLKLDPEYARAIFWMGKSYMEAGEFEHAAIEFKKLIDKFPKDSLTQEARKLLKACRNKRHPR